MARGGARPGAGRPARNIPNTPTVSARARVRARVGGENQRPWPADKVERWAIDRLIPYAKNARTHTDAPLVLEAKIPLGEVSGRIDHLGIDAKRQRLFVAELGNNSVGVVDLAASKVLHRIAGLSEPQGVAYVPFADSIFVANAGDGSVHILRGDDLAPIGRIELGEDADNV